MRGGGEDLARELQRIIESMEKTANDRDPVTYRRHDADFHAAMIRASANAFIQSAYNVIALRVQAFRNRVSLDAQNWRSLDEHKQVLAYVEEKDADAAAEALLNHIRGAFYDYVARITEEAQRPQ